MSHENNIQQTTADQLQSFSNGMNDAMMGLAQEMDGDLAERGVHMTTPLEHPVQDNFGTFEKKWEYPEGCNLESEIRKGVGELLIEVHTQGERKVLTFGATPSQYDPSLGGKQIADAGDPGKYLLATHYPSRDAEATANTFQYLDEADLQSTIRSGAQDATLGLNQARQRQFHIDGRIGKVVGLL